jgi:hypothetical protein
MNRSSVDALFRLAKARIVLHLSGDVQTLDSGGIVVSDLAGKVRVFGVGFLNLDHGISNPIQVYQSGVHTRPNLSSRARSTTGEKSWFTPRARAS